MEDFLTDDTTNELLTINGDFAYGDATKQNQKDLLMANKGDYKLDPLIGVAMLTRIDDDGNDVVRDIRLQMVKDGMTIKKLKVIRPGVIDLDAFYKTIPAAATYSIADVIAQTTKPTRKEVVLDRQSIWDLAIQHYGSVDGVLQLIIDNPTVFNFETSPVPGTIFFVQDKPLVKKVVEYFALQEIKPASAVDDAYAPSMWILYAGYWDQDKYWTTNAWWID